MGTLDMMPRTRAEAEKMLYHDEPDSFWDKECAYGIPCIHCGFKIVRQCHNKPKYGPDNLYCLQHGRMVDDEIMREPDYADMGGHT